MSNYDPTRRLVMASFKTVLGHNLTRGTTLTIADEPSARGEVDDAMARRLFASGLAIYAEDQRPTPVETTDQQAARLVGTAIVDDADVDSGSALADVAPQDDLLTWQADDAEAGKKAGDPVTKADLLVIAAREEAAIESDDNKPELIRKIMLKRAERGATEIVG